MGNGEAYEVVANGGSGFKGYRTWLEYCSTLQVHSKLSNAGRWRQARGQRVFGIFFPYRRREQLRGARRMMEEPTKQGS